MPAAADAHPRPEYDRPVRLPWRRYVTEMARLGLCPYAHPLSADGRCAWCSTPVISVSHADT